MIINRAPSYLPLYINIPTADPTASTPKTNTPITEPPENPLPTTLAAPVLVAAADLVAALPVALPELALALEEPPPSLAGTLHTTTSTLFLKHSLTSFHSFSLFT